jgi:hypothetical protein
MPAPSIAMVSFGDVNANGVYELKGTHNGQPFYFKEGNNLIDDYILIYNFEYGPYSYLPAWYVMKITEIIAGDATLDAEPYKPVPIYTPMYLSHDIDVFNADWTPLRDITSDELDTGVIFVPESTSSSSSSSSSSGLYSSSSSSSSSSSLDSSSSSSLDSSSSSSSSSFPHDIVELVSNGLDPALLDAGLNSDPSQSACGS